MPGLGKLSDAGFLSAMQSIMICHKLLYPPTSLLFT
jgi:hypothetical protein